MMHVFWIFGLLNFHGKWIIFWRGEKFSGTILEDKERRARNISILS